MCSKCRAQILPWDSMESNTSVCSVGHMWNLLWVDSWMGQICIYLLDTSFIEILCHLWHSRYILHDAQRCLHQIVNILQLTSPTNYNPACCQLLRVNQSSGMFTGCFCTMVPLTVEFPGKADDLCLLLKASQVPFSQAPVKQEEHMHVVCQG